jgi:hypothetical protein
MRDRFTHTSRLGRGRIRSATRADIYARDANACQYCLRTFPQKELTIDHVVPLALGGIDEPVNYVTCCSDCNQRKRDLSLADFAQTIVRRPESLPVHGDPILDNPSVPDEIKEVRRAVLARIRLGHLRASGKTAQKKIEKAYRREFWQTEIGKRLEAEFPALPSQVRVMLPEIRAVAKDEDEARLLIELAKSANTRNLIGTLLAKDSDVVALVRAMSVSRGDEALKKRLVQALRRFDRVARHPGKDKHAGDY